MILANISNREPEKFVSCRVGVELCNYHEDLEKILIEHRICGIRGSHQEQQQQQQKTVAPEVVDDNKKQDHGSGNFILVPISPPRVEYYDLNMNHIDPINYADNLLADLALPKHRWESEVAVSISRIPFYTRDPARASSRLDVLLRHALYLPTSVIVISSPEAKSAHPAMAAVVNERLKENQSQRLILFRVSLKRRKPLLSSIQETHNDAHDILDWGYRSQSRCYDDKIESTSESGFDERSIGSISDTHSMLTQNNDPILTGWAAWNSLRSYLVPDHRIGVCLSIDDDLERDIEEEIKWKGEPVRMVIMGTDRFSSTRGFKNSMRPAGGIKEFLKNISTSSSLMTSFVVRPQSETNVQDHLDCLSCLCDTMAYEYPDLMRAWDDTPLDPLQPLSINLDSNTYSVFEQDSVKYSKYQNAMLTALNTLLARKESQKRDMFILMVLGAGRGPLVDAMIKAIYRLNSRGRKSFKIYALDKNRSSVVSLKFKQIHNWNRHKPMIQTHIVEADMRQWVPDEKADIITTELLGSFSDNELSPECIDGTWRFSTDRTICLPQSYSSYLAPICSYRMRQELFKTSLVTRDNYFYDRIKVVKLTNYCLISEPQSLFSFTHKRLGDPPKEGANQREASLVFHTSVETVVHGFAGYFSSNLFGGVNISTVPEDKTPTMDSWFPVYIPIETPVQLMADSLLEVRFHRKESADKVWYEWQILSPVESRIHNPNGVASAMSKMI